MAKATAEAITEELYSLYDRRDVGAAKAFADVAGRVRDLCLGVTAPEGGSMTFITSHVPFGLAFPEVPTTHLRTYPDLGVVVLNGLASEQGDRAGVRCAVLVDPGTTPAPEIEEAAVSLAKRQVFVRGYSGPMATVRNVTDLVELFPYDLLLFATHCGDADGYRVRIGLHFDGLSTVDFLKRLSLASSYRWGLAIELIIEAFTVAKQVQALQVTTEHFSKAFPLIHGLPERFSPFDVDDYEEAFDEERLLQLLDRGD